MSTVVVNIEELYNQFKIRAELEAKVAELEAKLGSAKVKEPKVKKIKEPKEPKVSKKKPGLSSEELTEARRKNGLRLAESNRLKRIALKEAELAGLESKSSSVSETSEPSDLEELED